MKKGFTLIELMAVIIVLGIVAVIAYPMLGDTIENSKKKTFTSSLEGIYRTVDVDSMNNEYERDSKYTYTNGILTKVKANGSDITPKVINVKGGIKDGNGTVTIDTDGNIIVSIENDKFCGYTTSDNPNIQVGVGKCVEYAGSDNWTDDSCFGFDSSTGTITSYDESCGVDVVIPRNINGVSVKHIGDLAFTYTHEDVEVCAYDDSDDDCSSMPLSSAKASGIERFYIDDDISPMEQINSIDFTDATLLETIGAGSFYGSSLTSIDLSGLSNLTTIGEWAFGWNNLTTIDLSGLSNLTTIGFDAFRNNNLTTIDLSGLSNLTTIGDYAFTSNNLTTIDLSGLSNLTTIGDYAFSYNNLTTIDLSGITSLTRIEKCAFAGNDISSVNFSGGLANLTTIGEGAFSNSHLTSSDFNGLTNLITPAEKIINGSCQRLK